MTRIPRSLASKPETESPLGKFVQPDGSVLWPEDWDFKRKIREIDLARRDGYCGNPARELDQGDFLDTLVQHLRDQYGVETTDTALAAEKKDADRLIGKERFYDDPSAGCVAFDPDGSFTWPKSWSLDRKIRQIDLSRRRGDPNNMAEPWEDEYYATLMTRQLVEEHGTVVLDDIQTMAQENDQQVIDFRAQSDQGELK